MILKHIDNSRMSLTISRIEFQKEEILTQRPLGEHETMETFHPNIIPQNNINDISNPTFLGEQIKNIGIGVGDHSFNLTIKRSLK